MCVDCCKLLAILVIVFVVYEVYRHMYPTIGIRKWWDGVRKNIEMHRANNTKHGAKNKFVISAGFVRESVTALFSVVMACWILCFVLDIWNVQDVTNLIIGKIHDNFIVKYSLATTIIGAFIALICDYLIIYPKVFVSPNAFFAKVKNKDEEALKWYIENRSLFDCIDIHVEAYKCVCQNQEGDISKKKVEMRVNDISSMAGRWASSNDKAIVVVAKDISKEDVLKDDFDYIELIVKVTHALSRVTKVIKQQYYRADIYRGIMENDKLFSGEDPKARAEILTLKAGVLRRFMYARKFASYSMVAIIATIAMRMVFIPDDMLRWVSVFNVMIVSACILLVLFSCLRVIYKVPVYINEENENYMYRIVYKEERNKN